MRSTENRVSSDSLESLRKVSTSASVVIACRPFPSPRSIVHKIALSGCGPRRFAAGNPELRTQNPEPRTLNPQPRRFAAANPGPSPALLPCLLRCTTMNVGGVGALPVRRKDDDSRVCPGRSGKGSIRTYPG
jgi:hypothetical protein